MVFLYCDAWSCRCSGMGGMSVSSAITGCLPSQAISMIQTVVESWRTWKIRHGRPGSDWPGGEGGSSPPGPLLN